MERPTVIITGASRGLGAAAARIAAGFGARVALTARSSDQLQVQAQQIQAAGGQALAVPGDISRAKDCRAIIQETLAHFGRIDALVNNGGVIEPIAPTAEASIEEWERSLQVNLVGAVRLIQMALPHLRPTQGRIINITSGAAENVIGGWGAYSAAKAALNQLTKVLASEEPEITVLALRPGIVNTEMQAAIREKGREGMAEKNYSRLVRMHETGRLLPPEVPAQAIACLALYAPHEWSGEVLQWDDERVQQLVQNYPSPGGS
jgi:NAD(P)-dependent dehydrogenase (short-subunit alcohol dehydrogenase family)